MGKRKFRPLVDQKRLKILTPKLEWMITSWTPTTLPIFVEIGPTGSARHNAEYKVKSQLIQWLVSDFSDSITDVLSFHRRFWHFRRALSSDRRTYRRPRCTSLSTCLSISLVCRLCYCYIRIFTVKRPAIYIPPLIGKPWPAAVYNSKWRTDLQWH